MGVEGVLFLLLPTSSHVTKNALTASQTSLLKHFSCLSTSAVSVFERAQSGSPEGRRLGVENLPLHLGQSDLHLDRIVGLHLGAFRWLSLPSDTIRSSPNGSSEAAGRPFPLLKKN